MGKMNERKLRKELASIGKRLAEEGLVHSNLGTISVVLDRAKGRFLTKPGPLEYVSMGPDDFVEIDTDGEPQEKGKSPPSLNWLVHRACYETRPDINAVIHAHPDFVIAVISQKNEKYAAFSLGSLAEPKILNAIPLLSEEGVWLYKPTRLNTEGTVPIIPDLPPEGLAESARAEILKGNAFAIRNHGIVAVGVTLREAFALAVELEHQAKIFATILSTGGTPLFRTKTQIAREAQNMPPWFSRPFEPK